MIICSVFCLGLLCVVVFVYGWVFKCLYVFVCGSL